MPQTPHVERHFAGSATVRDVVIGMCGGSYACRSVLVHNLRGLLSKLQILANENSWLDWRRPRRARWRGGVLKRKRIGVAWATGVFLLVVFVAVAGHHAEGRRLADLLRNAQPAWLGAAAVFASFIVASMLATLAWVPGGLGTFEGTCVAMLHVHGVGIEAALAATLLARGFTFWLPMAPGLAIARDEMMRGTASPMPTAEAETP